MSMLKAMLMKMKKKESIIYQCSTGGNIQIIDTFNINLAQNIKITTKVKYDAFFGDGRIVHFPNNFGDGKLCASNKSFAWVPGFKWFYPNNLQTNTIYWIEFTIDLLNSKLILQIFDESKQVIYSDNASFSYTLGNQYPAMYICGEINNINTGFKGLLYLSESSIEYTDTNNITHIVFNGQTAKENINYINNGFVKVQEE